MNTIGILVYSGFQILDATGPASVFEIAGRAASDAYAVALLSLHGGAVRSSGGIVLATRALQDQAPPDTLLVAGGEGAEAAMADDDLLAALRRAAGRVRRLASVCSGAYLLAAAGLLDRRHATTHWRRSADFQRRFPRVVLDADRIFVRDGPVWTSAGISAGMDLALALVADDLGETVARGVARQLVVYYRRPGGQSQHAALLELAPPASAFTDLLATVRRHLAEPWTVERMAGHVHLSPRQFARRFRHELGLPPAHAVEKLRVEAAQALLEIAGAHVQTIAVRCGFGSPERMRRAFVRLTGRPPSAFRPW